MGVLPFLVVLRNQFLGFDDGIVILQQPFLREPGGIWQCLWPYPIREEPLLLRDVTYWLSFQLHGEWPPGFALVDLALHGLCAVLVYVLGRRVLARWRVLTPSGATAAALAGAILFAVHPLHVESVAWFSGRKDVLSSAFYLAAACTWLDYLWGEGRARRRAYAWTLVLYLCSMGSKSSVVGFPFVLVAADFLLGPRRSLRERVLASAPFVLLTAAYVKGYTGLLEQFDATTRRGSVKDSHPEPVLWNLTLTNSVVLEQYLRRMVLPSDQLVFSSQGYQTELTPRVIRALAVCVATAWLAFALGWRHRPLGFLFAWVLFALLPFLNIFPSGILYAERYAYLASTGVCLAIGAALALVCARAAGPKRRLALGLTLALLCVPLSLRSSRLARVFEDDGTLWTHVLEHEPDNYIALNNLAAWYGAWRPDGTMRDAERAEDLYLRLLALRPSPRNQRRYGRLLERMGRYDEAYERFRQGIGRRPPNAPRTWRGDPEAYVALARIHARKSIEAKHLPTGPRGLPHWVAATRLQGFVIETWPTSVFAHRAAYDRAVILQEAGQRTAAIEAWRFYLATYSADPREANAAAAARAALARLQGDEL